MAGVTIELTCARLRLWTAGPDDAGALLAFHDANGAHLAPWSPARPAGWGTLAYWQRRLAEDVLDVAAGRSVRFAIAWREAPSVVIGQCSLTEIVRGPLQQANLGYALAADAQGHGVMTETIEAVATFAFDTLRLHRLSANYMPTNERSARVLRRAGFVPVGYARDYLFIDGAWRDHVLTQRLDPANRNPT